MTRPGGQQAISSAVFQQPANPGIPYRVLVVEANIPLSEGLEGYDQAKLGSLLDFVSETMGKLQADKAEIIYPLNDRYIDASRVLKS
jgi:hypothetical protein